MILELLAAAGVAVLIVGVGVARRRGLLRRRGGNDESPEEAVRARYARGEISKGEYEQILRDLRR
jgi:uncharacterized membrane protein